MNSNKKPVVREILWSSDVIKIILAAALISICYQFLTVGLPLYIQQLGGSQTIAGLSMTFFMIASLLFRPLLGNLLDKKGRMMVLIIGTAFFIVLSFMYGILVSIPLLFVVRVLQGAAFSANSTATSTMITDALPESRMMEGIGFYVLQNTFAVAVGPLFALYIINNYSYSAAFTLTAGFGLVSLIVSIFIKSEKTRFAKIANYTGAESKQIELETGNITGWEKYIAKTALTPSIIMLFVFAAVTSVNIFLAIYAKKYNIENIGLFFTVQGIVLALARLFAGRLSKMLGSPAIIFISLISLSAALIGIFLFRSLPILIIMAVLYGIGLGFSFPELNAIAVLKTSPYRRGVANATFYMSLDLGIGAGSAIWGIIADLTGIRWVFFIAGLLPIVAIFIFIKYNNAEKKNIAAVAP